MRVQQLLNGGIALVAALLSVSSVAAQEPELVVSSTFPENNPFGHVVNGEKNKITVNIENKSGRNVTLTNIAGSFHHPTTDALVRNTSTLTYGVPLVEGVKMQIPYTFHSEFKPGDLRLLLWAEHSADGQKFRTMAYDSIVTIVEPEGSIFDFKMISTYLITLALLALTAYKTYTTLFPPVKVSRAPIKAKNVSEPVGSVVATGAGGYQEEWIPEHHLKKPRISKKKSGVATSGDETSGAEGK